MRDTSREPPLLRVLDSLTEGVGRAVAWLVIIMMLVQFAIVVMRYFLGINSVMVEESVMYMHAAVFMLGAAWTFKHDGHVRVDIFYRRFTARGRAWIDFFGTLLLLIPVALFIAATSFHYVLSSWAIMERSPNGGIPAVYLLKTLILVMVVLLLLQVVAQLIRQAMIIAGKLPNPAHQHEETL